MYAKLEKIRGYEQEILKKETHNSISLTFIFNKLAFTRKALYTGTHFRASNDNSIKAMLIQEFIDYSEFCKKLLVRKSLSNAEFGIIAKSVVSSYKSIKSLDKHSRAFDVMVENFQDIKNELEVLNQNSTTYRVTMIDKVVNKLTDNSKEK